MFLHANYNNVSIDTSKFESPCRRFHQGEGYSMQILHNIDNIDVKIGENWCRYYYILYSLWHVIAVTLCYSDWDSDCRGCECKWSSGKKVANCTNAKLNAIPQNLHAEVQVLILDHNFISSLGENIFIRNLPNLQKISLRHCGIKTINEKAFNGLKILVEVDLSYNNISKERFRKLRVELNI